MPVYTFSTDTNCPYCGEDIYTKIRQLQMENAVGSYFHFVCPKCDEVLQVECEPVPAYTLTKMDDTKGD